MLEVTYQRRVAMAEATGAEIGRQSVALKDNKEAWQWIRLTLKVRRLGPTYGPFATQAAWDARKKELGHLEGKGRASQGC